jgi:hypothetical protein
VWAAGAVIFLALALYVPIIGQEIGIVPIGATGIAIITGIAIACMAGFEVAKIIKR